MPREKNKQFKTAHAQTKTMWHLGFEVFMRRTIIIGNASLK